METGAGGRLAGWLWASGERPTDSVSPSSGPPGPTPWLPSLHPPDPVPSLPHSWPLLDVPKEVLDSGRACEPSPAGQEPGGPAPGGMAGGTGGHTGWVTPGFASPFCILRTRCFYHTETFYVRHIGPGGLGSVGAVGDLGGSHVSWTYCVRVPPGEERWVGAGDALS